MLLYFFLKTMNESIVFFEEFAMDTVPTDKDLTLGEALKGKQRALGLFKYIIPKKYNELCKHGFCLRAPNNDDGDKFKVPCRCLSRGIGTYGPTPLAPLPHRKGGMARGLARDCV